MRVRIGSEFGWLWTGYAVSTYGTWIAFGAFPIVAIRVLHASPLAVSLLDAAGLAVASVLAVPIGPCVDHQPKRPVMVAMDLIRFLAMASVPVGYLLGLLSYAQLLVVSVVAATSSIAFGAASGAYLKHLVDQDHLLAANSRFEGTSWLATAAGPPVGGALVALFGPVITVAADALSYLLSALAVSQIAGSDTAAPGASTAKLRAADLFNGWRLILDDRVLRRLFLNSVTVNGLIMATAPLLAVLLLGQYQFAAWQYGLAFGVPALGGFTGAWLSARLVARHGRHRVLITSGWLRSILPIGLALARPGPAGLLTVIVVEILLVTCMGVFNPINATERLLRIPADHAAQALAAWSISNKIAQAVLITGAGVLATSTTSFTAITVSGILLLGTPLFLPGRHARGCLPFSADCSDR